MKCSMEKTSSMSYLMKWNNIVEIHEIQKQNNWQSIDGIWVAMASFEMPRAQHLKYAEMYLHVG